MDWETLQELFNNPDYCKRKVALRDGIQYSYSQCGNIASGIPVLFCFGLMTSSIAVMFAHQTAIEHDIWLIAIDYPGIGESTMQENRSCFDDRWWSSMVAQFCDKVLGKDTKVRLLGHSLGGLHIFPLLSDPTFVTRVERAVLLSPWMYMEGGEFNSSIISVARTLPQFFQNQIIPQLLTKMSSASLQLAAWSNPAHIQLQAAAVITEYGMLQGQAGNEQMVRLALSKETPSLPQDAQTPIHIYHGTNDTLVLQSAVEKLVEMLKKRNCRVSFFAVDGADHNAVLTTPEHLHRVMDSLVGTIRNSRKERKVSKRKVSKSFEVKKERTSNVRDPPSSKSRQQTDVVDDDDDEDNRIPCPPRPEIRTGDRTFVARAL
jgi:pimeloyl-ACP methyl ester carboxylesterase